MGGSGGGDCGGVQTGVGGREEGEEKKKQRVVAECCQPSAGGRRAVCGTVPSSGTSSSSESVTALRSPLEVIYCATQSFSASLYRRRVGGE